MTPIRPAPYSKDYEITDAMFGAFRSPGGMKLFWTLTAVLTVIYAVVFLLTLPPFVKAYGALLMAAIENDSAGVMSQFIPLLFYSLLMMVLSFAGLALVRAAFFRDYFFGTSDGFPVRFGEDEVRQALAILGYYGVVVGGAFLMGLVVGFVGGSLGVAMGDSAAGLIAILFMVLMIALIIVMYWVMVVLAPAGALTALRGKTHVLAARHVSKGRRWAIFGSVLVAGLIGYVVYYILATLGLLVGLSGLVSAEMFSALANDDADRIAAIVEDVMSGAGFKTGVIIAIILTAAGAAFYQMIIAGPQAYFTKQWAEANE